MIISAVWPSRIGGLDVRARGEQLAQHLHVADDRGFRQRRRAVVVRRVDVRAGGDEPIDELGIVVIHGPVQRSRAVRRALR